MNLGSLFKEPASWGPKKQYQAHTHSRGTAIYSVNVHGAESSPILNLAPVFREPVPWGPKMHSQALEEPESRHSQPHGHHQISGHAHSVLAHHDSKLKHHLYHVANEPGDHHNHFRHQCDSEYCMDHNASHEHIAHPNISSFRTRAPRKHASQAKHRAGHTLERVKSPVLNLGSLFKEPVSWGPRKKSAPIIEEPSSRRRHSQSHRQIPGHAHAVPAHRDGKIKRHFNYAPDKPTDHHNHYRLQCDSNYFMDHNESHAHHGQPSVEHRSRHTIAPVRHRLEVRRAHHAYVPLTPAGLMIPDEASPAKESKKKRYHVSVPSRYYGAQHIKTPDYVHENDGPHEQHQPDGRWTLVIDKNRKHAHRTRAHRVSIGSPEMHLDALFEEHEKGKVVAAYLCDFFFL